MFIGHTHKNFLSLFVFWEIFFFLYSFLHLVWTNFIRSHVQLIYIVLLQCFIRHTCYFLSFSLVILLKKFCTVLLHRKFSYFGQFYIYIFAILLYHFLTTMFIRYTCYFLSLSLVILLKKFFVQFYFIANLVI